jgi:hypothetical protein
MKPFLFLIAAMLALPAAAQPPFLFTPTAKEIKQYGSGYSINLDNGQSLSVDRFGSGYRVTAGNREVAIFKQTADGWAESPGGRIWRLGKDGKWRTAAGDLMISRVITDIVLTSGKTKTAWRQEEKSWIRK